MNKSSKDTKSFKNAFTLIEILIAVAIIALLVILPILFFTRISASSRDDKRQTDLNSISSALESYKATNGVYPDSLSQLVDEGFLAELPVDPLDGSEVPGSNGALAYGYDYEVDEAAGKQRYKLIGLLEDDQSGDKDIIVINPDGPKIGNKVTELSAAPTQLLPTKTPIPEATGVLSITPTPLPQCNGSISCTGTCQTNPDRCNSYPSTQSGCSYTSYTGGGPCTQVAAPDQSCTATSGCTLPEVCNNATNYCALPTPTPVPQTWIREMNAPYGIYNTLTTNFFDLDSSGSYVMGGGIQVGITQASFPQFKIAINRLGASLQPQMESQIELTTFSVYDGVVLSNGNYFLPGFEKTYMMSSNGAISWKRSYRDQESDYIPFYHVDSFSDNTIIVGGEENLSSIGYDAGVVGLLSSNGTVSWFKKLYRVDGQQTNVYDVISNGSDVVAVGYTLAGNDLSGYYQAYVARLRKSDGTMLDHVILGTNTNDYEFEEYYDIDVTSDGGYILAGRIHGYGYGILVTKLNSSLDIVWSRVYPKTSNHSIEAFEVVEVSDGYVVGGYYMDTSGYTSGPHQAYFLKLNKSNGVVLLARTISTTSDDFVVNLEIDSGGYIVGVIRSIEPYIVNRKVFRMDGNLNISNCGMQNGYVPSPFNYNHAGTGLYSSNFSVTVTTMTSDTTSDPVINTSAVCN
ncbi:MAG: competence type IV pilus major pilin ComGC [Patescibacteria group bacterium]